MDFPEVNRSHIVPNTYLRNFAVDGVIGFRMVEDVASRVTRTDKVGVRKGFYKRHRPDGTRIDDIEPSMAQVERLAAPILREVEGRWPLAVEDRGVLAEFIGLQHVRGPSWARWHDDELDKRFEELRASSPGDLGVRTSREMLEVIRNVEGHLGTDTQRFVRMLSAVPKVAAVFGSMQWSLVKFDSPVVATSDQPLVAWPINCQASPPGVSPPDLGCLRTLEVRFPLSPRLVLLMTWLDATDAVRPIHGSIDHARNLNAFTVAQADCQWFQRPWPYSADGLRPIPASIRGLLSRLQLR